MAKRRASKPRRTGNGSTSEAGEIHTPLRDVTRSDAGTSPRPDGEPSDASIDLAQPAAAAATETEVTPTEVSDATLMAQLSNGEIDALEQLYERYSMLIFSLAVRILRDAQLAEDVVQEVFVRLWRRPASYDPARGRFVSWLMSVSRNRALDEQRRVSRRLRAEEADDHPGNELPTTDRFDDPQAGVLLDELRRQVREAMTRLPPAQREVIELAYFSGLTQVEIAERTGEPLGTVKTRVRLGMNKLREAFGADPGGSFEDSQRPVRPREVGS